MTANGSRKKICRFSCVEAAFGQADPSDGSEIAAEAELSSESVPHGNPDGRRVPGGGGSCGDPANYQAGHRCDQRRTSGIQADAPSRHHRRTDG